MFRLTQIAWVKYVGFELRTNNSSDYLDSAHGFGFVYNKKKPYIYIWNKKKPWRHYVSFPEV